MSKSELSPLAKKISSQLNEVLNLNPDLHMVLGVSGGPDSMALLYLLDELDITVTIAHVNYHTRGKDSNLDENLVHETAKKLNFSAEVFHANPSDRGKKNFQAWARDIRYSFFRKTRKQFSAEYIATAHHKDDQIETILMKVLRGAGPASWQGMLILENDICRPLIHIPQEHILDYLKTNDISYRVDQSNEKPHYARNLLRLELIPRLDELLPGWDENIMKLPDYGRQFENSIKTLLKILQIDERTLNYTELLKLDSDLRRSLILKAVKQLIPGSYVSGSALQEVDKLPDLQTGQEIQVSDSVRLIRNRNELKIYQPEDEKKNIHSQVAITRQELVEQDSKIIDGLSISLERFNRPDFNRSLYLREEALTYPVTLRTWKQGDSFQPFGMKGHQKVSDHLTNRKISSLKRKEAYVVETFDETICAVIFPAIKNSRDQPGTIDQKFRCLEKNELCVKISHQ